ncbi:MAG: hypothetical protein QW623_01170 [Candidatus Hadarchaeales archaeon]
MSQVSPAKIEYPTRNAVSVTENNGIDGFLPFSEGFHFKLVATFNPIFRDVSPQLLYDVFRHQRIRTYFGGKKREKCKKIGIYSTGKSPKPLVEPHRARFFFKKDLHPED